MSVSASVLTPRTILLIVCQVQQRDRHHCIFSRITIANRVKVTIVNSVNNLQCFAKVCPGISEQLPVVVSASVLTPRGHPNVSIEGRVQVFSLHRFLLVNEARPVVVSASVTDSTRVLARQMRKGPWLFQLALLTPRMSIITCILPS